MAKERKTPLIVCSAPKDIDQMLCPLNKFDLVVFAVAIEAAKTPSPLLSSTDPRPFGYVLPAARADIAFPEL
jgi:hypothetical protein